MATATAKRSRVRTEIEVLSRRKDAKDTEKQKDRERKTEQDKDSPPSRSDKEERLPTKTTEVRESEASRKRKEERRVPADVAARKKVPTKSVVVVALRMGYMHETRINPGTKFAFDAPIDKDGGVILPTWMSLEADYVPEPEPTLTYLPKVRGGASEGGLKGSQL